MNEQAIWQGTMFEALRHTLKQEGICAMDVDDDPNSRCGVYLRHDEDDGYTIHYGNGLSEEFMVMTDLMADARLYRESPGYELREMTLLAAMAYAQEHGLEWLKSGPGIPYRVGLGYVQLQMEGEWRDAEWLFSDPGKYMWRIPTDTKLVALTEFEVEALEVQDA